MGVGAHGPCQEGSGQTLSIMWPYQVSDEISIHWIDETAKDLPFVRESLAMCTARKGFRKAWWPAHKGRVVAIAEIGEHVRSVPRRFNRRVWSTDMLAKPDERSR